MTFIAKGFHLLDYRNILRGADDPHKSMRTAGLKLHRSHHAFWEVLDGVENAGVSWPLPDTVTNEMFLELLFPEVYQNTTLYVIPDYPYIHAYLIRKGVNSPLLRKNY